MAARCRIAALRPDDFARGDREQDVLPPAPPPSPTTRSRSPMPRRSSPRTRRTPRAHRNSIQAYPTKGRRSRRGAPGRPTRTARTGLPCCAGLFSLPVLIVVMLAILLGALNWRAAVVRHFPQTASLYAALGMPVNLRGLIFQDVKSRSEFEDGVMVLVVEGTIVNLTTRTLEVPRLRFALRNASGHEVYAWTALPSKTTLGSGQRAAVPRAARLAAGGRPRRDRALPQPARRRRRLVRGGNLADSADIHIRVLFDADAIAARNQALAQEIKAAALENLLVIAVLKGSFIFAADLIRALHARGPRAGGRVRLAVELSRGHGLVRHRDDPARRRKRRARPRRAADRRHPRIRPHARLRQGPVRRARRQARAHLRAAGKARQARGVARLRISSASSVPTCSSSATAWTSRTRIRQLPFVGVVEKNS